MDWSKKIGIIILAVIILASCSSRKNYGSVYFASGDGFNDTALDYDLSVDEYLNFADTVNNEIKSLSHYENDFIDSTNSLDSLYEEGIIDNDTIYIESIELVKIDSLSTVPNDSLSDLKVEENQIIDSLKLDIVDTVKVKIESPKDSVLPLNKNKIDSTKITYTDTIGLIREKGLENSNELKSNSDLETESNSNTESKSRGDNNSSKVKNIILVNPSLGNSKKDKPLSDSTVNKNNSSEKSNIENANQNEDSQNSERTIDSKKSVAVVPIITNSKEVKTDTVTIIKENSSYTKEIDSLKSVNDKLRSKAKSNNSNRDTLVYSVFFDSGQQKLSESNKEVLNKLIQDAKEQNYMIQLSGYADKSGSADFNKTLSENRVKSVFNYIITNGLNEKSIYYQSFGANYAKSEDDLNMRIVSCRLILVIDN